MNRKEEKTNIKAIGTGTPISAVIYPIGVCGLSASGTMGVLATDCDTVSYCTALDCSSGCFAYSLTTDGDNK